MPYISSSDNRIYTAAETTFGNVPAITSNHRIPAVKLKLEETVLAPERKDKTGTRSFVGHPNQLQKEISVELTTYLCNWSDPGRPPAYSCLFAAGLGTPAVSFAGGTVATADVNGRIRLAAAHGLRAGQAIVVGGDMRFVASVVDSTTVNVNAPFSTLPQAGAPVRPTLTFFLGNSLPSASLYDYWTPATSVQRVIRGFAVDEVEIGVNGDFHEFTFSGPAAGYIDNLSFSGNEGGLASFPAEPTLGSFDFGIVPGHLGQVWLGATASRIYTLTDASIKVKNGIEKRNREFGVTGLRGIAPGQREVTIDFDLFAGTEDDIKQLFQAARQRASISAMIQLGQQQGQLLGAYLKTVVPESPAFDDSETRLQWSFRNSRAQGTGDDEIVIALG